MTPAMAEAVEYLRAWHDKAKATTDLDRYPALLGEAEAYVLNLLKVADSETDQ